MQLSPDKPGKHDFAFVSKLVPEPHQFTGSNPASALLNFLDERQQPALFIAESAGRREVFDETSARQAYTAKLSTVSRPFQGPNNTAWPLVNSMRACGWKTL